MSLKINVWRMIKAPLAAVTKNKIMRYELGIRTLRAMSLVGESEASNPRSVLNGPFDVKLYDSFILALLSTSDIQRGSYVTCSCLHVDVV